MFGARFLGNTKLPHEKRTSEMPSERIGNVKEVLLPVSQHIGAPAQVVVSVGDAVKIGQLVARANGNVSSPIYASVSGTVKKIEDHLQSNGKRVTAIRIENDGKNEIYEGITPPKVNDLDEFISAVSESGIVGLGGAGFPSAVKLAALKKGNIDTVVINGAECEPYITSDTRTMLEDGEWIYRGIALIETYVDSIKTYAFGIEKNKPLCIKKMRETFSANPKVKIVPLPEKYPQGAEKVIVYNTTKRVVKEGGLPADVGVIVINVTTLAAIAKYMATGMPLVERSVTVDGSAVRTPKNVIAPIGTPLRDLISFVGDTEKIGKVLFGGPMMGIAAATLDEPMIKTTGGVTVMSVKDSRSREETACIHCGRCVEACPLNLDPTEYARALVLDDKDEKFARYEKYKVNLCMECGCCSYVCPANRPLVQNNRLAKDELRKHKALSSMLKE